MSGSLRLHEITISDFKRFADVDDNWAAAEYKRERVTALVVVTFAELPIRENNTESLYPFAVWGQESDDAFAA